MLGQPIEREYTLADLLRRPDVTLRDADDACPAPGPAWPMRRSPSRSKSRRSIRATSSASARRSSATSSSENARLPADLDYRTRARAVDRSAAEAEPAPAGDAGQAARISGVTPAAISMLLVHLKRGFARRAAEDRHERWPRAARARPSTRSSCPLAAASAARSCSTTRADRRNGTASTT